MNKKEWTWAVEVQKRLKVIADVGHPDVRLDRQAAVAKPLEDLTAQQNGSPDADYCQVTNSY